MGRSNAVAAAFAAACALGACGDTISDCDLDAATPSYATEVSHLLVWDHFPIRVAFPPDAELTPERQAYAQHGFDTWVTATGGVLSYVVTADAADADVVVRFDPAHVVIPDGAEGYTDVSYTGHHLDHADMWLGVRYPACSGAHEFGHALGIDGHSPDAADLMFHSGNAGACPVVTERDLDTMRIGYCTRFGI